MRFIPFIVIAAFFLIPPVLYAVAVYEIWRKEESLRPYTRAIVAAGLMRLAVLLISIQLLLTAVGRTVPFAPFFISVVLLVLASIGIRVVEVVNRLLVLPVGVYVLRGFHEEPFLLRLSFWSGCSLLPRASSG